VLQVKDELDRLPLYVRAGAFIPQMPIVQSMDETPNGPLELRVYPPSASAANQACGGLLYTDDGLTYNYKKGEHWHVDFHCTVAADSLTIKAGLHGNPAYRPWWKTVQVEVHGAEHAATRIQVGTAETQSTYNSALKLLTFTVPMESMQQEIKITY